MEMSTLLSLSDWLFWSALDFSSKLSVPDSVLGEK